MKIRPACTLWSGLQITKEINQIKSTDMSFFINKYVLSISTLAQKYRSACSFGCDNLKKFFFHCPNFATLCKPDLLSSATDGIDSKECQLRYSNSKKYLTLPH